MTSTDFARLGAYCKELEFALTRLGGRKALALSEELSLRTCRVAMLEEGECVEPELLKPLEADIEALARVVARLSTQGGALLARRGANLRADTPPEEIHDRLSDLDDHGDAVVETREALGYAAALKAILDEHLTTVRLAIAGPGQAMAELEDAIGRAQQCLRASTDP